MAGGESGVRSKIMSREKSSKKMGWTGKTADLMQKHLALRAAMGKVSQSDKYVLLQLNGFLTRNYPKIKIPNRIAILDFLNSKKKLTLSGRRNYVIHIRQFCLFLNRRGIPCYVPDKTLVPKVRYKPRYFPLSVEQVRTFMSQARMFEKKHPTTAIVGETYAAVIGLLWCTGMRRKEVVNLNHSDVDLKEGTLLVRQTKFRKTRLVVLDKSVVESLKSYFNMKQKNGFRTEENDPVFTNYAGERIVGHSLQTMFNRLVRRNVHQDEKGRYPCLHDLRHNFITRALNRFYTDPDRFPPQSYLPTLATYVGHVDMIHSQYYLHPDFNLLQKASEMLEAKQKKVA
jgi:integrase/recombinase XerD